MVLIEELILVHLIRKFLLMEHRGVQMSTIGLFFTSSQPVALTSVLTVSYNVCLYLLSHVFC